MKGFDKKDFENLLAFEKELFEELMKCIDSSDKKLNSSLDGKKGEETKNELIYFLQDVEEFVDLDGEKIGPYQKAQIVNIPKEIAKILIDNGNAERVEE